MAEFVTIDRVFETSITAGTGTYDLAGAVDGFVPFSEGGAGNFVEYTAEGTDGDNNWETGLGEILSGNRLARTHIFASSNAGAAVNWAGNTINVFSGKVATLGKKRVKSKSIAGGAGTTVLTAEEQLCDVLLLTGAITGNRVVEVYTGFGPCVVANGTSGAFTVTVKVNGQTGVAVTQGKSKLLYGNGTDVADGYTDTVSPGAASESAAGLIELATQAETDTGTDDARAVTPLKLKTTNRIIMGTEVPTTSGTAITFTGIASGTRRISMNHEGVGTSASSNYLIQIGDAGGLENTGYVSTAETGTTRASDTTGFIITGSGTAAILHGTNTLTLKDAAGFTWCQSGSLSVTTTAVHSSGGSKSLSAELTQVSLTTVSGDTFDAGSLNITTER